jgi:hypothetical protein
MTLAALRFNNPGNVSLPIKGYSGPGTVVGISGQPGYASFPTMADGLAAQSARLTSYVDGSTRYGARTTIASLNSVYAEDPNWKNNVSKFSGIGVNDQIDPNNQAQMSALQGGIIRQETGKDPSVFGFNGTSAPMNSNNPTSATGVSGLSGSDYAAGNGNYYYNPSTGAVTPTTDANPPGTSEGFGIIDSEKGILYGAGTGPASGGGVVGGSGFSTLDPSGGIGAGSTSFSGLGAPNVNPNGYSLDGATLAPGVNAGTVASASGSSAGGSMTVPQAIDTQTRGAASDTSSINKQTAQNTDSLNKTSTANTKAATDKAQALYTAATGSLSDYFVRVVFVVVGLIALAAGLMLFKPVQQAAGAVASKIPVV